MTTNFTDPLDGVTTILDTAEAAEFMKARSPGRSTLLEQDPNFATNLLKVYYNCRSIRRTAESMKISPTTVKKYLKGRTYPVGRPAKPKAWTAKNRTPVHAWFVNNRNEPLPQNIPDLARFSGFGQKTISRYLKKRHDAAFEFLRSLPDPRNNYILFEDTLSRRVPSPLIKSFTLEVDRFTLNIKMLCILKPGGQRTVSIPFREYVFKVTGRDL